MTERDVARGDIDRIAEERAVVDAMGRHSVETCPAVDAAVSLQRDSSELDSEEPEIKLRAGSRYKACNRVREMLIRANKGEPLKGRAQITAAIENILQQYFDFKGNAQKTTIGRGAHEFEFREILYALAVEDVTPLELATRLLEPTWSEDDEGKKRKRGRQALYTTINSRVGRLYNSLGDRKTSTTPIFSRQVFEMAEITNGGSLPEPLDEEDIKRLAGAIHEQVEARRQKNGKGTEHISTGKIKVSKVGLYEAILRNRGVALGVILSDELGVDLKKLDKKTTNKIISNLLSHIKKSHELIFRGEAAQNAGKFLAEFEADLSAAKAAKEKIERLCGGAEIGADLSALTRMRSEVFSLLPELARIRIMLCFPTAAPDEEEVAQEERMELVMRERFALAMDKITSEPNDKRRDLLIRYFIFGDPDAKGAIRPKRQVSNHESLQGGNHLVAPKWTEDALCAQTDPDAFFPEKSGSTVEVKKICEGCEVRTECLEYALGLGNDGRFGVWGGRSERERRTADGKSFPDGVLNVDHE